jgi:co-chaperonin GroES (HSP10)
MTLKALQNCLIIEPYYEKHELFVLPHTEAPETGIVVAVGPDCKEIKVGDHVYYGVGQEFSYGKEFVVMREPHVLGVMNG